MTILSIIDLIYSCHVAELCLKCALLGLYCGRDPSIAAADVYAAQVKARAAGKTVEIVYYPDAGHGFHADDRTSYTPADAKTAWNRAIAWFEDNDIN